MASRRKLKENDKRLGARQKSYVEVPLAFIGRHSDIDAMSIRKGEKRNLHAFLACAETSTDHDERRSMAIVTMESVKAYLRDHFGESGNVKTVFARNHKLADEEILARESLYGPAGGKPYYRFVVKSLDDSESASAKELRNVTAGHRGKANGGSNRNRLAIIRNSQRIYLADYGESPIRTDDMFTGIFDRVMRYSSMEKVPENRLMEVFQIMKTRVVVEATTRTGRSSQLATLSDQRVIRAVITELIGAIERQLANRKSYIERHYQPLPHEQNETRHVDDGNSRAYLAPESEWLSSDFEQRSAQARGEHPIYNDFSLCVVSIARKMGYTSPHSGQARKLINQSLRRLYDTDFRIAITDLNSENGQKVRKHFNIPGDGVLGAQFLTNLVSETSPDFQAEDMGDLFSDSDQAQQPITNEQAEAMIDPYNERVLRRTRWWRISINQTLFDRLLDPEQRPYFLAHQEILGETVGIAQTLYNHFNSVLGRTARQYRPDRHRQIKRRPLKTLHETLWPNKRYSVFEDQMMRLMRGHNDDFDRQKSYNRVVLFGFIVELFYDHANDRHDIQVSPDPDDRLVGERSTHNNLIKAEQHNSKR